MDGSKVRDTMFIINSLILSQKVTQDNLKKLPNKYIAYNYHLHKSISLNIEIKKTRFNDFEIHTLYLSSLIQFYIQ